MKAQENLAAKKEERGWCRRCNAMLPMTEFYQIAGRRKSTLCKTHHKEYYKSLRKKGSNNDSLDD